MRPAVLPRSFLGSCGGLLLGLWLALAPLPSQAHEQSAGALTLDHLWIKGVPGARNGAMYVEIINNGDSADRLVGARAHIAKKVMLHTQRIEDGITRMRHIDGIDIPAGSTVRLAPGGDHIMLIGLKGMLMDGELVPVTLVFEKAGEISLQAVVEGMIHTPAESDDHHDDHHGGNHDQQHGGHHGGGTGHGEGHHHE